jgi:prephenate dehydrogenase
VNKVIAVVGTGLIGGSTAIDLRNSGFAKTVIGVDKNKANLERAKEKKIIDKGLPLEEAVLEADITFLAVPVNAITSLVPLILEIIPEHGILVDLGSTKGLICKIVKDHPKRGQFVAAHPIAGTENSGPDAAFSGLFKGKTNIICEKERSSEKAIEIVEEIFRQLEMKNIYMDAEEHDKHVAYISHLSHVSSFLLGQTVLDIEKDEKNIFTLAGSGFASTVRLAKSSPEMWAPIFEQNSHFLSIALEEYIAHLQKFHEHLKNKEKEKLLEIMLQANKIRPVLEGITAKAAIKE